MQPLFQRAAALSLWLFPIRRGWKSPSGIVKSWINDSSNDWWQWERWLAENPGCNFGIDLGKSSVFVVDIDTKLLGREAAWAQASDWWAKLTGVGFECSFCIETPTGGWHIYFSNPDRSIRNSVPIPGVVDIRGTGGYVVAPWSHTDVDAGDSHVKATGRYTPISTEALAIAPARAIEALKPGERVQVEATKVADRDTPEHVRQKGIAFMDMQKRLHGLAECEDGGRNNFLHHTAVEAWKYVDAGLIESYDAETWLQYAAMQAGLTDTETSKTIRSAREYVKDGKADPLYIPPIERSTLQIFGGPSGPPLHQPLYGVPPLVESLAVQRKITMLTAQPGTGKTTLIATLAAQMEADRPLQPELIGHDITGKPRYDPDTIGVEKFCMLIASHEDAEGVTNSKAAWHTAHQTQPICARRVRHVKLGRLFITETKNKDAIAAAEAAKVALMTAFHELQAANPGFPVIVVIDSVIAALEDASSTAQVINFFDAMRTLAEYNNCAVVLVTHPPKGGSSDTIGAVHFSAIPDIVAVMGKFEQKENGTRVTPITFAKHRDGAWYNRHLIMTSTLPEQDLYVVPSDWGTSENARRRKQEAAKIPFISSIKVQKGREPDKTGVKQVPAPASATTDKPVMAFVAPKQ